MGRSCGRAAVVLVCAVLVAACGSSSPSSQDAAPFTVPETTATSAEPPPTTATAPATTTSTPTTVRATTMTTTATTTTTAEVADARLADVGGAGQAIVVTASRYGATTATFTAYDRGANGWRRAFGPWPANVGTRGIAPPGEKREGDGRTPSGVYGFDFLFGVDADPGVKFPYRRVTSRSIVWDDDPSSPLYNTWVDLDRQRAGAEPEPMYAVPAYNHGAVIAYNTARTPGLGSAIFLHVSTGGPTAGCVSLPQSQLVEVLRWLDPARDPRIVLSVG